MNTTEGIDKMQSREQRTLIFSTDLDGTLLGRGNYELTDALPGLLVELESDYEVIWAINTGRRLASVLDVVQRADIARRPDYLVDRETFLYVREDGAYRPVTDWNEGAERRVDAVQRAVAPHLEAWASRIAQEFPGAKVRLDSGVPLSVQSADVAQGMRVRAALQEWTRDLPGIEIIRNAIWVAIWAEGCDKGSVLAEISRRHGVPLNRIMAVGDSENDLPMLSKDVCGFPVAPANAEESVKAFVEKAGGWVSSEPDIDGVLDGVKQFLQTLDA